MASGWLLLLVAAVLAVIFFPRIGKPRQGVLAQVEADWGDVLVFRNANERTDEPYSETLWLRESGGGWHLWHLDTMSYGFISHCGLRLIDQKRIKVSLFPSEWTVYKSTNGWRIIDGKGRHSELFLSAESHIPKNLPPLRSRPRGM